MNFEHEKSWDILTAILASETTAKDAWIKFIGLHEEIIPKPYWTELKQIDIETEQVYVIDWVTDMVTKKPISKNIVAFWIGLLKLTDKKQNEIPTIYFGGADNYDKDDNNWACDLKYLPENRYVQPGLLQEIDNIAKADKENYEFLDWILPIAYCAFTFNEIIQTKLDKKLFLTHRDKLFLSVGHDGGDYVDLTPIENLDNTAFHH